MANLEFGHGHAGPVQAAEVLGVVDEDLLRVVDLSVADGYPVLHDRQPDPQLGPAGTRSEYVLVKYRARPR